MRCGKLAKVSDAAVRFWTEVQTWTSWTELKVRFKVQSFVWTEPKVQFKVQLAVGRFEPEPNLGLKLVNNCEFSWILLEFSAQK